MRHFDLSKSILCICLIQEYHVGYGICLVGSVCESNFKGLVCINNPQSLDGCFKFIKTDWYIAGIS